MILEGNQRGGAASMANHLLNSHENEHVEVHEVSGFASHDVFGALQEIHAVSKATQCRQFMFSMSLNPPQNEEVPVEYFEDAIEAAEKKLGLVNQPRVIVFHEKEGRRHAHCVWSRIDGQEMKAINLPYYKMKLQDVSKEIFLQYDWNLPKGFIDKQYSDPTNFSREEWQQAKRAKEDPKLLKRLFTQAWEVSDSKQAFTNALKEYGFTVARGDRRGYVAVDYKGEVYSLSRWAGVKTKQLKDRLGNPELLPSVDTAKADIAKSMTHTLQAHLQQTRSHWQAAFKPIQRAVHVMRDQHKYERKKREDEQNKRWDIEERVRIQRLPRGFKGIWHRVTGKYQKVRAINERETKKAIERDRAEKQKLITRQLKERQKLQKRMLQLRYERNEAMLSIRLDIGRYAEMRGKEAPSLTDTFNRQNRRKERNTPDFEPEL